MFLVLIDFFKVLNRVVAEKFMDFSKVSIDAEIRRPMDMEIIRNKIKTFKVLKIFPRLQTGIFL